MRKYIALICFALICVSLSSCAVYTVDECYPSRVYYDYYGNVYYRPAPPRYKPAPPRYRPAPNRHHHPTPHYSKPSPKPSVSHPHQKPNPRPVPSSRQPNKPNNRR